MAKPNVLEVVDSVTGKVYSKPWTGLLPPTRAQAKQFLDESKKAAPKPAPKPVAVPPGQNPLLDVINQNFKAQSEKKPRQYGPTPPPKPKVKQPKKVVLEDSKTGQKHEFDWHKDTPPTQYDVKRLVSVVKNKPLEKSNPVIAAANAQEVHSVQHDPRSAGEQMYGNLDFTGAELIKTLMTSKRRSPADKPGEGLVSGGVVRTKSGGLMTFNQAVKQLAERFGVAESELRANPEHPLWKAMRGVASSEGLSGLTEQSPSDLRAESGGASVPDMAEALAIQRPDLATAGGAQLYLEALNAVANPSSLVRAAAGDSRRYDELTPEEQALGGVADIIANLATNAIPVGSIGSVGAKFGVRAAQFLATDLAGIASLAHQVGGISKVPAAIFESLKGDGTAIGAFNAGLLAFGTLTGALGGAARLASVPARKAARELAEGLGEQYLNAAAKLDGVELSDDLIKVRNSLAAQFKEAYAAAGITHKDAPDWSEAAAHVAVVTAHNAGEAHGIDPITLLNMQVQAAKPKPAAKPKVKPLEVVEAPAAKPEPDLAVAQEAPKQVAKPKPVPKQPAATPKADAPANGKEPWQMTREEAGFTREVDAGADWQGAVTRIIDKRAAVGGGDALRLAKKEIAPHLTGSDNGSIRARTQSASAATFDDLYGAIAQRRGKHFLAVESALKEGKPVPAEVLADYPDLVPGKTPELEQASRSLRKDRKGAAVWNEAKRLTKISLGKSADFSTAVHEMAHHFLNALPEEFSGRIVELSGKKGKLSELSRADYVRVHERFAKSFEKHLMDGSGLASSLGTKTMEAASQFLKDVYAGAPKGALPAIPKKYRAMLDSLTGTDSSKRAMSDVLRKDGVTRTEPEVKTAKPVSEPKKPRKQAIPKGGTYAGRFKSNSHMTGAGHRKAEQLAAQVPYTPETVKGHYEAAERLAKEADPGIVEDWKQRGMSHEEIGAARAIIERGSHELERVELALEAPGITATKRAELELEKADLEAAVSGAFGAMAPAITQAGRTLRFLQTKPLRTLDTESILRMAARAKGSDLSGAEVQAITQAATKAQAARAKGRSAAAARAKAQSPRAEAAISAAGGPVKIKSLNRAEFLKKLKDRGTLFQTAWDELGSEDMGDLIKLGASIVSEGHLDDRAFASALKSSLGDVLDKDAVAILRYRALRQYAGQIGAGKGLGPDIFASHPWGIQGDDILAARRALAEEIDRMRPKSALDPVRSTLRAFRLSDPINRVKDVASNLGNLLASYPEEHTAGVLDRVLFPNERKLHGPAFDTRLKDYTDAINEGRKAWKDEIASLLKHGDDKILEHFDIKREAPGPLKFVGRMAGVTDVAFKDIARRRVEAQLRRAHPKLSEGTIRLISDNAALEATLSNPNVLGDTLKTFIANVERKRGKHKAAMAGIVLDALVPFPTILANVAGRGSDYVIGAGKALSETVFGGDPLKGALEQRRRINILVSRNLYGLALFTAGKYLYEQGFKPEEVNNEYGFVSYGDMEDVGGPLAPLFLGAKFLAIENQISESKRNKARLEQWLGLVTNQPVFGGMKDITGVMRSPTEANKAVGKTIANTVIPGAVRGLARRLDPEKYRKVNTKDFWSAIRESFVERLPKLREGLPKK